MPWKIRKKTGAVWLGLFIYNGGLQALGGALKDPKSIGAQAAWFLDRVGENPEINAVAGGASWWAWGSPIYQQKRRRSTA